MTIHTVLIDRAGYVVQVWQNTRLATIDQRKHGGTLLEVAGHVVAGMRYVDGAFYAAPLRPRPEAVRQEGERRINLHFPTASVARSPPSAARTASPCTPTSAR